MRSERERLAWALVGWFNLIAFLVIGIIVADAMGYAVAIAWYWIVGFAVLTVLVIAMLLWMLVRAE